MKSHLQALAGALDDAWANARTVPAPTAAHPSLSREEAYEIQEMVIARRLRSGRRRVGWKLGLTSAPPPATPIVGTLLDDMVLGSGARLSLGSMVGPMVEAEIVVEIAERIDSPVPAEELASGPHRVAPGIEVIDYRTVDSTGPVDWIADNSTVAYAVMGDLAPVSGRDLAAISATLYGDGSILAEGAGSVVMGDPLAAVSWLSGHLADRGITLEPGHVVLTGSLTGHHLVPQGTTSGFRADFGDLGVVSVGFGP